MSSKRRHLRKKPEQEANKQTYTSFNHNHNNHSKYDLNSQILAPLTSSPDKWKLVSTYVKTRGLVKQHIESFNYFIDKGLKKILKVIIIHSHIFIIKFHHPYHQITYLPINRQMRWSILRKNQIYG